MGNGAGFFQRKKEIDLWVYIMVKLTHQQTSSEIIRSSPFPKKTVEFFVLSLYLPRNFFLLLKIGQAYPILYTLSIVTKPYQ